MTSATDTLATADALEADGVDARTARATARAIETGCAAAVERTVTKEALRAELKAMEVRLILYGLSIAGALFAALRFG